MKTLLLETATEKAGICLLEEEHILEILFLEGGPHLSTLLALETQRLLKKHAFQPDCILVGEGPGSYTGTRVGISLAKALSYGWNLPLLSFCSPRIFFPQNASSSSAVIIDARSGGLYVLPFQELKASLMPEIEAKKILTQFENLYSPHPHIVEKRLGYPIQSAALTNLLDLKPSPLIR